MNNSDFEKLSKKEKLKVLFEDRLSWNDLQAERKKLKEQGDPIVTVDFSNVDFGHKLLENIFFFEVNFDHSNFTHAELKGVLFEAVSCNQCCFQQAKLYKTDFKESNLQNTYFGFSFFEDVTIRFCNLRKAKFNPSNGLMDSGWHGTDLYNSDICVEKFDTVFSAIKDHSKILRSGFFSTVIVSLSFFLTFSVTDFELLLDSRALNLPLIRSPIPVRSFYLILPVILFVLQFYFLIILDRVKFLLQDLPFRFPNGSYLPEVVFYSSIVSQLACKVIGKGAPGSRVGSGIFFYFTLFYSPFVVVLFWFSFLKAHSAETWFHIALIAIMLFFTIVFLRSLKLDKQLKNLTLLLHISVVFLISFILFALSFLVFYSHHKISFLGNLVYVDISGERFSSNQLDHLDDYDAVAHDRYNINDPKMGLQYLNINHSNGEKVIFCSVDLRGCSMVGASLNGAKFHHALLNNSILRNSMINNSEFYFIDLGEADLSGAEINSSYFRSVIFLGGQFPNALKGSTLEDVTFPKELKGTQLNGVVIRNPKLMAKQIENVNFSDATLIDVDFSLARIYECFFSPETTLIACSFPRTRWVGMDLRGMDFSQNDFEGAEFVNVDLRGASFDYANLRRATFSGCLLEGTTWKNANLQGASFECTYPDLGLLGEGLLDEFTKYYLAPMKGIQ